VLPKFELFFFAMGQSNWLIAKKKKNFGLVRHSQFRLFFAKNTHNTLSYITGTPDEHSSKCGTK
jgi:hypothetical protein